MGKGHMSIVEKRVEFGSKRNIEASVIETNKTLTHQILRKLDMEESPSSFSKMKLIHLKNIAGNRLKSFNSQKKLLSVQNFNSCDTKRISKANSIFADRSISSVLRITPVPMRKKKLANPNGRFSGGQELAKKKSSAIAKPLAKSMKKKANNKVSYGFTPFEKGKSFGPLFKLEKAGRGENGRTVIKSQSKFDNVIKKR